MADSGETLTIGDVNVHQLPEVAFHVKYKAKIKVDEKEASGADDATATVKGREVRDITIALSWPNIHRINRIMGPVLKTLSPATADGGKPFDFAHVDQDLDLGDICAVRSVLIKEMTGPDSEPGSGVRTVEYGCDSWNKPSAAAGAGATPTDGDKKKFVLGSELPAGQSPPTAKQNPPDVQP
jgi:hypothetical protein